MANKFDLFFESNYGIFLHEEALSLPYEKVENKNNMVGFSSEANINKNTTDELIHPVQDDNPPVEGDPIIIAKRNRRLRSKCRNWQLWNNKEKKWINPNARYTRRRDVEEEIKKMNPSD